MWGTKEEKIMARQKGGPQNKKAGDGGGANQVWVEKREGKQRAPEDMV